MRTSLFLSLLALASAPAALCASSMEAMGLGLELSSDATEGTAAPVTCVWNPPLFFENFLGIHSFSFV
jgi:hypothetical protein